MTEKQIIQLDEARRLKLKRYYTGIKCKNGHIADRIVSNRCCSVCLDNRARKYKSENYESVKAQQVEYRKTEEFKQKRNEYQNKKYKTDNAYRLRKILSSYICRYFKYTGKKKKLQTEKIIGCSYSEFIRHIERQFKADMSWSNYGEWQIDHIVPISQAKTTTEIIELNHFTNLRPLWAIDNIKKSNKAEYLI